MSIKEVIAITFEVKRNENESQLEFDKNSWVPECTHCVTGLKVPLEIDFRESFPAVFKEEGEKKRPPFFPSGYYIYHLCIYGPRSKSTKHA